MRISSVIIHITRLAFYSLKDSLVYKL